MPRIRGTAREDCDTKNFLSQPKKVLVTLIRFICSFFSTARRMNQEAPPQLSGACLYSNPPLLLSLRVFLTPPSLRTPPLYFAVQNAGEEGESNLPLIAVQYSAYGARQGEKVILDFVTATADIFLTPPSFGHLPYILQCKTQRRSFRISSIVKTKITRHATGHGKGGV